MFIHSFNVLSCSRRELYGCIQFLNLFPFSEVFFMNTHLVSVCKLSNYITGAVQFPPLISTSFQEVSIRTFVTPKETRAAFLSLLPFQVTQLVINTDIKHVWVFFFF